ICIRVRNRGIGKKVLSLFIHGLFHDLGYSLIKLDTDLKNERAQHVYEKLGFQKIRVNLNAWKDQLGNNRSSVDYELTKDLFNSYL
ncbi:MAG: GNAT family N-acetyltransferase, partial [Oscillospiraceae bacterium]|nr:GNAT family N-acetyltransferase [Oscillospiraceae bacterium]